MTKRLAWEKNWLKEHGWSEARIAALEQSGEETPVEYLTREAEFCGAKFRVNKDVLIPRLETEQLVKLIKKELSSHISYIISYSDQKVKRQNPDKVELVEIGTGSGVIAITLAREWGGKILATDVSAAALEVARSNVVRHQVGKLVMLQQSDLLGGIDWERVKLVTDWWLVANLPYVPTAALKAAQNSVKNYEPHLALDGSIDGFSVIRRLLQQVSQLQKKPKQIWLEIDPSHDEKLFAEFELYEWKWEKDFNQLRRFVRGVRKS